MPGTEKTCPRCGQSFQCQPEDIAHCQCSQVTLTPEVQAHLAARYDDCLCLECLRTLAAEQA